MSDINVRRGMTNARFNEKNSGILFGEIAIVAIITGFIYHSWWVFGGVLLALIIGIVIPGVAIFVAIGFSIVWGFIGYAIGSYFSSEASIVLAAIGFLAGLGLHLSAIEWVQDIAID
ncbi:MAG: hypothetical protein BWX72_01374 [Firmicutes bacterium ADurb.Bin080]|nr:MAG: hypothetical protein BWX72_01374 [Firmicutes bacterium ADurb.Bin080]